MGHDEEFAAFVSAAWVGLVRTGRLLAADPADSEDLVQSALLKTYRRWRSVDDPISYTRTVLARLAIRSARRKWRGETPTAVVPDRTSADEYLDVESADAVRRILASLPPAQRAVLALRFYCDFSEAQTAAALSCSIGTVKSRTHRALAALRIDAAADDLEVADE